MKNSKYHIILSIFLSIIFGLDKVGTSAAKFLSIGAGARSISMGGAFTSVAKDPSTMYWNPSGISRIDNIQLYIDHSDWLADINYDYLGLVFPIKGSRAVGLNFTSLSMPEMSVTRYGEDKTGETFRAGSYAIGLTFAGKLTDRFSIGFNGKFIKEFISKSFSSTYALDVGTLFNTVYGPILGMSISNFGPKMQIGGVDLLTKTDDESNNPDINANLSTESFNLPLTLRFGISDVLSLKKLLILWSIDAVSPTDNSEYVNIGLEMTLFNKIFFRTGTKGLFLKDREELFTIGGGLNIDLFSANNIQIDYAYEVMKFLNDIHKFSIVIPLNK
jgi:hypothetical protein